MKRLALLFVVILVVFICPASACSMFVIRPRPDWTIGTGRVRLGIQGYGDESFPLYGFGRARIPIGAKPLAGAVVFSLVIVPIGFAACHRKGDGDN